MAHGGSFDTALSFVQVYHPPAVMSFALQTIINNLPSLTDLSKLDNVVAEVGGPAETECAGRAVVPTCRAATST